MGIKDVTTYTEAVDAFIEAAEWLTDADLPGVLVLKSLAKSLDAVQGLPQAALLSQFTMTFRDLRNRAPKASGGASDPLAQAMQELDNQTLFGAAGMPGYDS